MGKIARLRARCSPVPARGPPRSIPPRGILSCRDVWHPNPSILPPPLLPKLPTAPRTAGQGHLPAPQQAETQRAVTHLWGFVHAIPHRPFPGSRTDNGSMICLRDHICTCLRRVHVGQAHLCFSEAASTVWYQISQSGFEPCKSTHENGSGYKAWTVSN